MNHGMIEKLVRDKEIQSIETNTIKELPIQKIRKKMKALKWIYKKYYKPNDKLASLTLHKFYFNFLFFLCSRISYFIKIISIGIISYFVQIYIYIYWGILINTMET